jgi:hypothetical protein
MGTMDWIALVLGLIWGVIILIIWKRNPPQRWPWIFGIGGGIYMFILFMTYSLLQRPKSDFVYDLGIGLLFALAVGIVCYISGHMLARRFQNKRGL